MKNKIFLLAFTSLLLVGCKTNPNPNPGPGPDPDPTNKYQITFVNYDNTVLQQSEVEEGQMPAYTGATPTKPEDDTFTYAFSGWTPELEVVSKAATYTATYTSEAKPPVVEDLGVKTIAEVKELCKSVTDLNEAEIGLDKTRKVTIRAMALEKKSLVKTTSKFGLNVSSPYKIFFGDNSGFIAVASEYSKDGTTLWGKVGDHAGKETSRYEVTGYLSIYLGQPELYVCDREYTWDEKNTLGITCDVSKYSQETVNLDGYYEKAAASKYNCAGHGYTDVYTVTDLYCYDKKDDVYMMTDGKSVMKVYSGKKVISTGYSYELTGFITLTNYVPSLSVLSVKNIEKVHDSIDESAVAATTVDTFKTTKCPKDDTTVRQDSYIKSFKTIYKSTVYFSAYTENGNYYVTMGDRYDTHEEYSVNHLVNHISYGEVSVSNENFWNIDIDSNGNFPFCPVSDYIGFETTCDVYYSRFLQEFESYGGKNNQPIWKVFLMVDLLPEVTE